tara:strand:+ start:300 stop:551 length:252 start_codon:yes stop_codon:yes gene_type:complete
MDIRQAGNWYPRREILPYHQLVLIKHGSRDSKDFQLLKWDWDEGRYKYQNPESSYSYRSLRELVPGEHCLDECCTLIERICTK